MPPSALLPVGGVQHLLVLSPWRVAFSLTHVGSRGRHLNSEGGVVLALASAAGGENLVWVPSASDPQRQSYHAGTPATVQTESKEPRRQAKSLPQQQVHSPALCSESAGGAKGRRLPRLNPVTNGLEASGRSARAMAGSKRKRHEEASSDVEQVAGDDHRQPTPGRPKAGSKKKETASQKESEPVSTLC